MYCVSLQGARDRSWDATCWHYRKNQHQKTSQALRWTALYPMPPWDFAHPPTAKQHSQIHRMAMPSGGRMLSSQGRHNQALGCSQTAQVLWLLALNQDTLWLSHMLGKMMPVQMLETGLLLFTGCWQWHCTPHILPRPGASSKKGNYTSQKV